MRITKSDFSKKKLTKIIKFLCIAGFIFLTLPLVMNYEATDVLSATEAQTEDLEKRVRELEAKLDSAKNKASSLSRDIDIIENNINLKTVQIAQAELQVIQKEEELTLLKEDIRLLEIRLSRLDGTIDTHEKLLAERLKKEYKNRQQTFIEVLMSTDTIGDFISRITYLKRVQAEDKEIIAKMNVTKDNYESQQDLLEDKKQEVEILKKSIEAKKAQAVELRENLAHQKSSKDDLLRVTKNDEKRYQDLLESAKKELSQIQSAANIVVREGKGVEVEEGEIVGTMGNSGFSTGAHLHFSIYSYSREDFEKKSSWGWYHSNYLDPLKYLKSKSIVWDTGCSRDPKGTQTSGKGKYSWPMSSPRITQNFGSNTCYNWMYGGKPHPALDMVGIGNISIRSIADGEAYFCRNCLGDGGNGVFIFHDDDKMSLYWHLK